MQFVRSNGYLTVVRITGPKHNLLGLRIGEPETSRPACERLPPVGCCAHGELDEECLVDAVLEGVDAANAELGAAYRVSHVRYVENDSPPVRTYTLLAYQVVRHLHAGGVFLDGVQAADVPQAG